MLVVRGFIAFQDRSPRLAGAFATRNEMSSDALRPVRNVCHRSTASCPAWLEHSCNSRANQGDHRELMGDTADNARHSIGASLPFWSGGDADEQQQQPPPGAADDRP